MIYILRNFDGLLLEAVQSHGIMLALIGARRTGKSTSLEHLGGVLRDAGVGDDHIVYITLDRLSLREQIEETDDALQKIIEQHIGTALEKSSPYIYCMVDEAQKAPVVFEQIKVLYDKYKSKLQFILSGSSSLSVQNKSAETLGGRIRHLSVYPFSLREKLVAKNVIGRNEKACAAELLNGEMTNDFLKDVELKFHSRKENIMKVVEDSLVWGSLPEINNFEKAEDKIGYLDGYKETYLDKDIRALDQVGDLRDFTNCLKALAAQDGGMIAPTELAKDIGIHFVTFKKYLSILQATGIQNELPPYIQNMRRRLTKASKNYLMDLGLVSYLTRFFDFSAMQKTGVAGNRLENFMVNEILKHAALHQPKGNLYYWRTSGGVEVDCVYEFASGLVPFEIKYSSRADKKWSAHLTEFMSDYKTKVRYGVVVYNGKAMFDPSTNIYYVPAYLFF